MPVPHDYYGHHSPEPRLHNRHNSAPYIEPDWQANIAKDQLPDLSTIGRGPKGDGIYIGNIRQDGTSIAFDINSDLTGEVIATIGPMPTGGMKVYGDPDHTPVSGEEVKFYVDYQVYEDGQIKTVTQELTVPPGAMGSLIYLYPETLDRTNDDTYQVDEKDLIIYNRASYGQKPNVRVNDIIFLETHKRHPATKEREAYHEYWLTFGTVNAVEKGKVVFTARTFYSLKQKIHWDDIEGKPEFHQVAFTGEFEDLENYPTEVSYFNNDADYQSGEQVTAIVASAIARTYRPKGSVETFEDLPDDAEDGDVYNVVQPHEGVAGGTNWAWIDSKQEWDPLAGIVDLSDYATNDSVDTKVNGAKAYTDTKFTEAKQYADDLFEPSNVFIAKYEETTYEELVDAVVQEKGIFLEFRNNMYPVSAGPVNNNGTKSIMLTRDNTVWSFYYQLDTDSTWSYHTEQISYENIANTPTKLSQFTNDQGYQTQQQVQNLIDSSVPNVSVATTDEVTAAVDEVLSERGVSR